MKRELIAAALTAIAGTLLILAVLLLAGMPVHFSQLVVLFTGFLAGQLIVTLWIR